MTEHTTEDDLVIPDEEVEAATRAFLAARWTSHQDRPIVPSAAVRVALEAAARLRTHATEVATTVGYAQGIEAVRAEFNRMWSSGDWEGQVSMGFACALDQAMDEIKDKHAADAALPALRPHAVGYAQGRAEQRHARTDADVLKRVALEARKVR